MSWGKVQPGATVTENGISRPMTGAEIAQIEQNYAAGNEYQRRKNMKRYGHPDGALWMREKAKSGG